MKGRMFRLGRRECFHQLSEEPAYSCLCVYHLGFLLVEGVCAQHLSHGFKRGRQRQHELFELVLVLACTQDTHTHTRTSFAVKHTHVTVLLFESRWPRQSCRIQVLWNGAFFFLFLKSCAVKQLTCVTEIDHQQAPQRRVEGGPAPHVAQVGLVVYSQEGEMFALERTQQTWSQSTVSRCCRRHISQTTRWSLCIFFYATNTEQEDVKTIVTIEHCLPIILCNLLIDCINSSSCNNSVIIVLLLQLLPAEVQMYLIST